MASSRSLLAALALVVHRDPRVALLERVDVGERLLEGLLGAEHRGVVVHRLLQFASDVSDLLLAVLGEDVRHQSIHHGGGSSGISTRLSSRSNFMENLAVANKALM